MKRFLTYSLSHNRAIRLIYLTAEGSMRQVKAVVEQLDENTVSIYTLRPPARLKLPLSDLLSADYLKTDDGME